MLSSAAPLDNNVAPDNIAKLKALSVYLEELESELAIFFTLSVDLILICEQNGKIIKTNPAWKIWLGWEKEELIGRNFYEFVKPDDTEKTKEIANNLCTEPLIYDYCNQYICKDGSYITLSWRAICHNNKFYATARPL